MDSVEHIGGTSRRAYSPKVSALGNSYRDVIDVLVQSGMTLTPTSVILGDFESIAWEDQTILNDPRLQTLVPAWALDPIRARVDRLRDAELRRVRAEALERHGRTILALTRSGGRVVAGTDAPIVPYGVSLSVELELYVKAGLTPSEALQTATTNAAEALGAGADLGSIEPGKLADMVLLNGNPLSDIRHTRNVSLVIKNGEVFTLEQLLGRAN